MLSLMIFDTIGLFIDCLHITLADIFSFVQATMLIRLILMSLFCLIPRPDGINRASS